MNKKPTIDDVANFCGLSTATVSRYINGTAQVSAKNASKIQAAIDELHYVPHTAAQILASQKTNTIGLIFSSLSGVFFGPLLRGIETRARQDNYSLLVHSVEISPDDQIPTKRILGEHNTDGLIIFADSVSEDELRHLADSNFPVVLIHRTSPPFLNIPFVTVENKSGVYKLISHLIEEHDYQRIAFLRGPELHEDGYWREAGYRKALLEHGIPFDPELVELGDFNAEAARKAVLKMLDKGIEFDAVFAGDDDAASGSMMALREKGLQVPEDIAVVGFDDQILAPHLSPPLTTVHAPIEDVGYYAVDKLINLIHNKPVEIETLLSTDLIIRQSCGCSINIEKRS
jgi:DNA-binding LacI/PurR family transcriptional regulator